MAQVLEAAGFTTWWDSGLLPGDRFRDEIDEHLNGCRVVIIIWTPESDQVRLGPGRGGSCLAVEKTAQCARPGHRSGSNSQAIQPKPLRRNRKSRANRRSNQKTRWRRRGSGKRLTGRLCAGGRDPGAAAGRAATSSSCRLCDRRHHDGRHGWRTAVRLAPRHPDRRERRHGEFDLLSLINQVIADAKQNGALRRLLDQAAQAYAGAFGTSADIEKGAERAAPWDCSR